MVSGGTLNVVHVPLNPLIVAVPFGPITISLPGTGDGIDTSCDVIWSSFVLLVDNLRIQAHLQYTAGYMLYHQLSFRDVHIEYHHNYRTEIADILIVAIVVQRHFFCQEYSNTRKEYTLMVTIRHTICPGEEAHYPKHQKPQLTCQIRT